VNVGARQVVQKSFHDFLASEPGVIPVVVWCDERTFRWRHSVETHGREFRTNYSPELNALWQTCREVDRLVDTK
jgi:hypothetical protein